ncbi:4-hydroxy-tetrahydrodipicolinate reductase [bacterium]|nr:4-hydroxy-tetrahydrodipicolinate reductase [bacterium]
MIRLAVCGAAGRMGRRILSVSSAQKDIFTVTGAVDMPDNPLQGQYISEFTDCPKTDVKLTGSLEKVIGNVDAVIDFSSPQYTLTCAQICRTSKTALVIGTTGVTEAQITELKKAAEDIPIVLSPNMSVGVNLLFNLVKQAASILDDEYDIEIVEAHHRFKKDAPSGTAKRIAEIIAQERAINLDINGVYGRKGIIGERKKGEIGVHAVRLGNVVGDHTVSFANLEERIELTHKAQSKDTFALGSLTAVRFIEKKQNGLYDMQDVLGLNK